MLTLILPPQLTHLPLLILLTHALPLPVLLLPPLVVLTCVLLPLVPPLPPLTCSCTYGILHAVACCTVLADGSLLVFYHYHPRYLSPLLLPLVVLTLILKPLEPLLPLLVVLTCVLPPQSQHILFYYQHTLLHDTIL